MTSSGSISGTFDVAEIIEEALERIGDGTDLQTVNGGWLETARRSLDLILREWDAAGYASWASTPFSVTTTANVQTVNLPAGTIDVLPGVMWNQAGAETPLARIPLIDDWALLTNKADAGTPSHYRVDRTTDPVRLHIWMLPDAAYTITGWRLRRLHDVVGFVETVDAPQIWVPALTAELAWKLFQKLPAASRDSAVRTDLMAEMARCAALMKRDNAEPSSWRY